MNCIIIDYKGELLSDPQTSSSSRPSTPCMCSWRNLGLISCNNTPTVSPMWDNNTCNLIKWNAEGSRILITKSKNNKNPSKLTSTALHCKSCDLRIQSTITMIRENPSLNHEIVIRNKKWHLGYCKSSVKQMVNDVYCVIVISKIIPNMTEKHGSLWACRKPIVDGTKQLGHKVLHLTGTPLQCPALQRFLEVVGIILNDFFFKVILIFTKKKC
jgi:hypothetical protein